MQNEIERAIDIIGIITRAESRAGQINVDELREALSLAIDALQAQIKPECETCQWCSRGQLFVQRNYATVLRTGWMLPTYCPNCGRELKGGE